MVGEQQHESSLDGLEEEYRTLYTVHQWDSIDATAV